MAKRIMRLLMVAMLSVFAVIGMSKESSVYADDSFTITFHSGDDGEFEGGSKTNAVEYGMVPVDAIKYSHTSNVDDTGRKTANYGNSWTNANITGTDRGSTSSAHVITIPGAATLNIELYYNGESVSYDWASVWTGSHPTYTATSNATSEGCVTTANGAPNNNNKFGGSQSGTYTVNGNSLTSMGHTTLTIQGNTVTFGFKSDSSGVGQGYGYYAIVTGYDSNGDIIQEPKMNIRSGEYKEPTGIDNKTFKSWNTIPDGSGMDYTFDTISEIYEATELYAQYYDPFTVVFHSSSQSTFEDGSDTNTVHYKFQKTGSDFNTVIYDGTVLTPVNYVDDGVPYKFSAWYDNPDLTGTPVNVNDLTTDIDLYAAYEEDVITKGTFGCPWVITGSGELIIGKDGQECTLANAETMFSSSWPWYNYRSQIKSARTRGTVLSSSGSLTNMFYGQSANKSIDLTGFDTSNATNFSEMFNANTSLTSLNLGDKFDTSNGTDFHYMFRNCSKLASLDLGDKFDTSNGTDFSYMFYDCFDLASLDLGDSFDTSNGTNFSYMFYYSGIHTVDFSLNLGSKFDTSNGTDFSYMFGWCETLTQLDLGNKFDTSNGTDFSYMFYNCYDLNSLDLGDKFNTSKGTNFGSMFQGCNALTSLDLGDKFDTSNGKTFSGMFQNCNALTSLDLGDKFDTSNGTSFSSMFSQCKAMTSLNLGDKFDTSNGKYFDYMFSSCSSLTSLELGDKFDTSNGMNFQNMFGGCSSLTSLDFGDKFDTSNGTNFGYMFNGCSKLTSLNLGDKFDTSKGFDLRSMFSGCSELEQLDLSLFNTRGASSISGMFSNMSSLKTVILPPTFYFNGNGAITGTSRAILPNPAAPSTAWKQVYDYDSFSYPSSENQLKLTPEQLRDTWDPYDMAGIWIWSELEPDDLDIDIMYDENVEHSYESKWKKLSDNTWEYVFNVFDDTLQYYLYEDPIEGFHSDIDPETGYVVIHDKKGEITNTTNTELGSLTVSKNVVEGTPGDHPARGPFSIQITLEGLGIPADGMKIIDGVVFKNGVGNILLSDGESKTITGLPEGVTYSVLELDEPVNCVTTYSNQSGSIEVGENNSIITNTYTEVEPEGSITDIILSKVAVNAPPSMADTSYQFVMETSNMDPFQNYTATNSNGTSFVYETNESGEAIVAFSVKSGESVIFGGIPIGTQYKFTEAPGKNWRSSYEITNEDNNGTIAQSEMENTSKNRGLSTNIETAETDEVSTVLFTNKYDDSQNLIITKNVTDAENEETPFAFTVNFSEIYDSIKEIEYTVERKDGSLINGIAFVTDGEMEMNIDISAGDVLTFVDLPAGIKYKVTEEANSLYTASYEIIDDSGEYDSSHIARAENHNEEKNKSLSTEWETVDIGEQVSVKFANSRSSGSLTVAKRGTENIDASTAFDIKITLEGDRSPISGAFSCAGPDPEITEITFDSHGEAIVSLKKEESITINGLPVGATYSIEEIDSDREFSKTYTNKTGEIIAGNVTATVNNDILSNSDITISKIVTGNMGSRDKKFTFSISMQNGGTSITGDFITEGTDISYVTFNSSGIATFTLSHGQTITIKDVPIGAEYTVTETDYSSDGYTTTSNNASGTISEEPEDNRVTFTNQNGAALPTAAHTAIGAGVLILVIAIFGLIKTRHKKEA